MGVHIVVVFSSVFQASHTENVGEINITWAFCATYLNPVLLQLCVCVYAFKLPRPSTHQCFCLQVHPRITFSSCFHWWQIMVANQIKVKEPFQVSHTDTISRWILIKLTAEKYKYSEYINVCT